MARLGDVSFEELERMPERSASGGAVAWTTTREQPEYYLELLKLFLKVEDCSLDELGEKRVYTALKNGGSVAVLMEVGKTCPVLEVPPTPERPPIRFYFESTERADHFVAGSRHVFYKRKGERAEASAE